LRAKEAHQTAGVRTEFQNELTPELTPRLDRCTTATPPIAALSLLVRHHTGQAFELHASPLLTAVLRGLVPHEMADVIQRDSLTLLIKEPEVKLGSRESLLRC